MSQWTSDTEKRYLSVFTPVLQATLLSIYFKIRMSSVSTITSVWSRSSITWSTMDRCLIEWRSVYCVTTFATVAYKCITHRRQCSNKQVLDRNLYYFADCVFYLSETLDCLAVVPHIHLCVTAVLTLQAIHRLSWGNASSLADSSGLSIILFGSYWIMERGRSPLPLCDFAVGRIQNILSWRAVHVLTQRPSHERITNFRLTSAGDQKKDGDRFHLFKSSF